MAELSLAVVPRAAADGVGPYTDGVLRVRVTRPAVGGDANRAVVKLVGRALGVPPSAVSLASGLRSRRKRVSIGGLTPDELARRLSRLAD